MVLRLIELGYPLDEVLCCDTTMEFPSMYRHIEKVRAVVEAAGVKFTLLRSPHDFAWWLTQHPAQRPEDHPDYGKLGLGWPGVYSRWCTKQLKVKIINDHLRELRELYDLRQYIGIAADEQDRLDRKSNQGKAKIYPLDDWGWAEADAMHYCNAKGYDWEGLYKIFKRVSCWCCPFQPLEELRKMRMYFPELWHDLLYLDRQQFRGYKGGRSVAELDKRFALEEVLEAAGERIDNRAFYTDLKRHLAGEVTAEQILQERHEKREAEIAAKQVPGQQSLFD